MSTPDETRVLLVKPGELLLVGNVGESIDRVRAQALIEMFQEIGIRVVFFAGDIDVNKGRWELA